MERERGVDAFDEATTIDESTHLHAVPEVRTRGVYERYVKPVIDITAGVALTILTAPIVAVVVPLIWWKMGRPAIFRQTRIGRYGEPFTVYKFRTMLPDRRGAVVPFDGEEVRLFSKEL